MSSSVSWNMAPLNLVTDAWHFVLSSPRTGQGGAGSQQKECMPNSKVIWSLLIEYKICIQTQISCLSLGSGQLLLLPYAVLMLRFEKWQWEGFTEVLDYNHHLSLDFPLTNHIFCTPGVAPPTVLEHCMSTSCWRKYPRAWVTVSEAVAVTKLLHNNINTLRTSYTDLYAYKQFKYPVPNVLNLPTAPTDSCYNFVLFVT
jgi:hypothetical protein